MTLTTDASPDLVETIAEGDIDHLRFLFRPQSRVSRASNGIVDQGTVDDVGYLRGRPVAYVSWDYLPGDDLEQPRRRETVSVFHLRWEGL